MSAWQLSHGAKAVLVAALKRGVSLGVGLLGRDYGEWRRGGHYLFGKTTTGHFLNLYGSSPGFRVPVNASAGHPEMH